MKLYDKCFDRIHLLHELMHALGFVHEHTRPDCDKYITVFKENILEEAKGWFSKQSKAGLGNFEINNRSDIHTDIMDTGYAYDSVMHYSEKAFSKNNKEVMTAKSPEIKLGSQKNKLTEMDIYRINILYNCYSEKEKISKRPELLYRLKDQDSQFSNNCSLWVTVNDDDTCWSLANSNNVELAKLIKNNPDHNCNDLKIGEKLCISRETSLAASCGKWHTIVEGEDCDKIRKQHNLSQEEFNEMNKYLDCKQLTPGNSICVPLEKSHPIVIAGFNFSQRSDGIAWSNDCVFYGNDFDRKQTDLQFCMDSCAKNPSCFYFTWNRDWYNGTCFLKRRFPPEAIPYELKNCVCGYKQSTNKDELTIFSDKDRARIGDLFHLSDANDWDIQGRNSSYGSPSQSPIIIEGFNFYRRNNGIMWANDCTFNEHNIDQKIVSLQLCGDLCAKSFLCSYFTWNPSIDNGTCILKTRFPLQATPRMVQNCICGYKESMKKSQLTIIVDEDRTKMNDSYHLTDMDEMNIRKQNNLKRSPPQPPTIVFGFKFYRRSGGMMWANDCAFNGYNIDEKIVNLQLCGNWCARNPTCSHFTWNPNIDNGTCYLRSVIGRQAMPLKAKANVCGYRGPMISEGTWKQGDEGFWWANGCDFSGKEIDTLKTNSELCGYECTQDVDCTHFTWKPLDGGTCILKRSHERRPNCAAFYYICGYIGKMDNGGPMLCR